MPSDDAPARRLNYCSGISLGFVARLVGVVLALAAAGLLVWAMGVSSPSSAASVSITGNHDKQHLTVLPRRPTVFPDIPRGSARRKLPVLILQVDDRPISPALDANTSYASLSMAINYHYALRQGYDYRIAVVENDEAHKANVTISRDAVIKSLDELLSNAKGNLKGCFHPILGVQRSSPW